MSENKGKTLIEKLNGRNYVPWSYRMKLYMKTEKCWEAVINDARPNAIAAAKWNEMLEKADYIIGTFVDDNQLPIIKRTDSPKAAWDALSSYYKKSSFSSKMRVLRKLYHEVLPKNGDMEAHLIKLMNYYDELCELGHVVDDEQFVSIMLTSVGEDYDNLITALDCRDEDDLTLAFVKSKLLDEYDRKKKNESSNGVAMKVFSKPIVSCHFCDKKGHVKKFCSKFIEWTAAENLKNEKFKKYGQYDQKKSYSANKIDHGDKENDEFANYAFCISKSKEKIIGWFIDSGASCHITNNVNFFTSLDVNVRQSITVANGELVWSSGKGDGKIVAMSEHGQEHEIVIRDVLYVPEVNANLLSVKKLTSKGYDVNFSNDKCVIKYGPNIVIVAKLQDGLYKINESQCYSLFHSVTKCVHYWHEVFGHRSIDSIQKMFRDDLTQDIQIKNCKCDFTCEVCLRGKMCRKPFPESISKSNNLLELIHTDVCGPMENTTPSGNRYFLTFIDDYSKYCTVYLLKQKSEVGNKMIEYIEHIKTKFGFKPKIINPDFINREVSSIGCKPKVIRSDRGGEYVSNQVQNYLKAEGIHMQYTTSYTPQQNGIAERKNRYLVEMAKCMLIDGELSKKYWGEAILTANYVQNRTLSRTISSTPFEKWNFKKPNVCHFKKFGSDAYVMIPKQKRRKFDENSVKLKFVGYDENSKAYRFVNVENDKITISRDVEFIQINSYKNEQKPKNDQVNESKQPENITSNTNVLMPRRSNRINKGLPPDRLGYLVNDGNDFKEENILEPKDHLAALSCEQKEKWIEAINDELNSLKQNQTWELVERPVNRSIIGCKWTFKLKRDVDGHIARYKARLVAKGYSQKFGSDYDEVFAPVVRQVTFRTLLAVAAKRNMNVKHIDVKTAFLYGELEETIYMEQPPGFEDQSQGEKVCKLKKSLYGLKQAARVWNETVKRALTEYGYTQSTIDPCLFYKKTNGKWCYVLIYVDDIITASEDDFTMSDLEENLKKDFDISSLGRISYYLGCQIERDGYGDFFINQSVYIKKIIEESGMKDAKSSLIPLDTGYYKINDEAKMENNSNYRKVIGQLLYVSVNSRPDISASVSILSRKVSNPTKGDWNELMRVVRYLKGTCEFKLRLSNRNHNENLLGYADADWAENRIDRKSNSGYIFKFNGGTISWACRKQTCVSLSSCEAEYIALCEASQEMIWLRKLLNEMHATQHEPTILFEDNQSCIKSVENSKFSNRTKHIDTKIHFVHGIGETKELKVIYCPTSEMVADLLTKPLNHIKLKKFRLMAGVNDTFEEEC